MTKATDIKPKKKVKKAVSKASKATRAPKTKKPQPRKPKPKKLALKVNNVAASYGQKNIIEKINFDVAEGEIFGLMGLNGAGKTTLIKIMLGLLEATEGHIEIFGEKTHKTTGKDKLAYLPERFEPPHFLTGLEFIEFSLRLYQRNYEEEAALQGADRLALLRDALKNRVNTYSKGMRQKTGLLSTFMTECPLLILDEPMSGLDPQARAYVKDEVLACKKRGMTVFLSSHILADMDEICDRVAVMHDGNIRFVGTAKELKKQTKQEYLERAFLQTIQAPKVA